MDNIDIIDGRPVIIGPGGPDDRAGGDDARRAGVRLLYNGTDITRDIAPWCLGLEHTDSIEEADDLQLELWDDGRWTGAWMPSYGARLDATLVLSEMGSMRVAPLGSFTVDELAPSGPPRVVRVKCVSADVASSARREKKSRAWENVTLRGIAQTIAANARLELMYLPALDPVYQRRDQQSQSDLEFLAGLALREGCRVKISDGRLIVYPQADYDAAPAAAEFYPGDGRLRAWEFAVGISSAYSRAVVKYRDAAKSELLEYAYVVPGAPPTGQTWRVNRRCESRAEAERVARNEVARANRSEQSGNITLVGDPRLWASSTIRLSGLGELIDGIWAIEEARHTIWPYETRCRLNRAGATWET